ncbi:MAG: KUP/HAK/KT family potassium transporter [Microlunatus sp.]|uniref:potassium transporter Kup n=1 Tax=Intrasporangium sp. TaxID=1925024 RepID=UPI00264858CC|nr:KUP/HAK/KT family potassium transporter [Intrasporangium sp.]MDN5763896.1 KUP/HAK/KT family potassium transporter [Microlunatus sp.]MDN5795079.1 KUP/HAK/KT family potassium transporter [Intrasporangium sp.]
MSGKSDTGSSAGRDEAAREGWAKQALVALATLGVVYGDLGTSVIYSLHTVFTGGDRVLAPNPVNVLGVLSLVFWTLILIVSVKYMVFVLRADNRGEGGMFALIALLRPWRNMQRLSRRGLVLLGLAGASMLYAGVMITPAISILSAVEGLQVASPGMARFVLPVTLVILVLLFAVQHFGSTRVGWTFGPIMAVWFLVIAALGAYGITVQPQVVSAVNPAHAVEFFSRNGVEAFLILFGVFLVTTGAEALYADIGHFGRSPIRWIWFVFVLPALLLNYFGQGAMLLQDTRRTEQPFYHLIPSALLYPLVGLAMLATIVASQAAITGAFSMTHQAARLGLVPRSRIVQTSEETSGQVYVPFVNWVLMAAGIGLVVLFQSSNKLASTYGISISTTMVVTTVLAFVVAREWGRWPLWQALVFLIGFLAIDLTYFGSNLMRIPHGGWFPAAMAALLFTMMATWRRGGELLARRADTDAKTMEELLGEMERDSVARVPGTAVFVTPRLTDTPASLAHHVRRNHALQEQVVLLTVLGEDVPRTTREERRDFDDLGAGFFRVVLHYGYMQQANVPSELATCTDDGLQIDLKEATYYIEHESPLSSGGRLRGLTVWRRRLFGFLVRNSLDVTIHYQIPSRQVVDVSLRVRI